MSEELNPTGQKFSALLAEAWEWEMQDDPLRATRCGDHRFNDRLPAVSEQDYQRRRAQIETFLARLNALDRAALSPAQQIDYDIQARFLGDWAADLGFHTYRMPFGRLGGFHTDFLELGRIVPLNTAQDYENYVARLDGFAALVEQYILLLRGAIDSGHMPSRIALQGMDGVIRAQVVDDGRAHLLYGPFLSMPPGIGATEAARLADRGRRAIERSVSPGYQALLRFVVEEYLPAASDEIAASALPDGRAFYEHCVRKYTTLDLTPQQVHDIGLAEVASIRAEMDEVMRRAGFDGDLKQFIHFLRTDPRFYVDTPEALMKEAALILKRIDGELPRLFKTLPRTPYGIRQVPDYIAPETTTAYYFPPAGDGTQAGFYYLNTYDLKSRPLYELEALSLHEAVPGHHLQIALQQELDMPPFRRFGWVTAFGEGWALYAERLGLEMGFYQDPYSDFGRLTYAMWRACRLVVDTGMHDMGWTRQQAIDLMAENTALTMLNISNEIDRYISWPGQALAYKIGEIKLRELRRLAEQSLGARFDLREFHHLVHSDGGIPLDLLEAKVRRWVAEQQA